VSLNGNPGFCCAQSRLLARGRVEGAVIVDGKVPHAVLLELLIELSAGTLIHR
jgi:acetylglutamate kinase